MSSTNYEMSTTTTIPSSEMNKLSSLYIPRVFANLSTEYVAEVFESLNLGVVDRVEAVPRLGDKKTYMAFVYFSSWNSENKAAANLAERINCPTPGATQARIVYDDPWFWILLPNKSEKPSESKKSADEVLDEKEIEDAMEKQELNDEETIDILTDMVEDLQGRLLESEGRIGQLEKELYDVRRILLTGNQEQPVPEFPWHLYDPNPMSSSVLEDIAYYPPPPKLVRQNAVASPPPPCGPIKRQTQVSVDWCHICCQDDCCCPPPPMFSSEPERVREPDASVELPAEFPEEVPMLPASPFIVEPTHFHSKLPVREILSTLAAAFKKREVTVTRFKVDDRSCGFYCSYYYGDEKISFVVKAFSTGTENTLIEFQRRWGAGLGFCRIYDAVSAEIQTIIDPSVPRSPQSFHQFVPHCIKHLCNLSEVITTEGLYNGIAKHLAEIEARALPDAIPFDEFMRNTIAEHIANDGQEVPPAPEHPADWWPSEKEIAEYRQDRHQRRMEQACIEQVRVDGMGLVYPIRERSDNFWCDP